MNKKTAGFIVIAVALLSLAMWEFWGRENFSYKEIAVLADSLPANTLIKQADIKIKKVDNPPANALLAGDTDLIVGMETAQFVAEDMPLCFEYFRQSQYAVGEESGKAVLCVPSDWLLSLPQTVRRGDEVIFYNGNIKLTKAVVAYVKDASNKEVVSVKEDRTTASSVVHQIEIIGEEKDLTELSKLAGEGKRFTLVYY